jgi:hypothetical protein
VAEQAGIRALFLTETHRHVGIGDIVNLVRPHTQQHAIHNARHMAGDTAARLAGAGMMGVSRGLGIVLELRVATGAHQVGLVFEFERSQVPCGSWQVPQLARPLRKH